MKTTFNGLLILVLTLLSFSNAPGPTAAQSARPGDTSKIDPSALFIPDSEGGFSYGGLIEQLEWGGNRLFGFSSSHVFEFDVTDINSPELVFEGPNPGNKLLTMEGQRAYFYQSAFPSDLGIYDYPPGEPPQRLGSSGCRVGLAGDEQNGFFYSALSDSGSSTSCWSFGSRGGLGVLDVHNPAAPSAAGHLSLPGGALAVVAYGDYVYAVSAGEYPQSSQLHTIHISDPDLPVEVSTWTNPAIFITATSLIVDHNRLYVHISTNFDQPTASGIFIFDLEDPANPSQVGFLYLGAGKQFTILNNGNWLATTDGFNGLVTLYDISDPSAPASLAQSVWGDPFSDITSLGSLLIAADPQRGLRVLDFSTQQPPEFLGADSFEESYQGMLTAGSLVFLIGTQDTAVTVYDVSDPAHPSRRGSFALQDPTIQCADWKYLNGLLYLSCVPAQLIVLDVSDPDHLTLLSQMAVPDAYGYYHLDVAGGYAYLVTYHYAFGPTLVVYDVSAPDSPTLVSATTNESHYGYWDVDVHGDFLYLTDHGALYVYDITDPADPVPVGQFGQPGSVSVGTSLLIEGDLAYLASEAFISVLDLSQPAAPLELGRVSTGGYTAGFDESVLWSNYLLLDTRHVVDISQPAAPRIIGMYPELAGNASLVDGHILARVADSYDHRKLQTYDLAPIRGPAEIGSLLLPSAIADLKMVGQYALALESRKGFHMIDLAQPGRPRSISYTPAWGNGEISAILTHGQVAYLVSEGSALLVYDLGVITRPRLVEIVHLATPCSSGGLTLRLDGNRLAVSNGAAICLYDVTSPAAPVFLTSWAENAYGMAFYGNYIYITHTEGDPASYEVRIYDLSNPAQPEWVGTVPDFYGMESYQIEIVGSMLCRISRYYTIVNDISDPLHPGPELFVIGLDTIGPIDRNGKYLYTSNDSGWDYGLSVTDVGDPEHPVLLRRVSTKYWYPNAMAGFGQNVMASQGFAGLYINPLQVGMIDPQLSTYSANAQSAPADGLTPVTLNVSLFYPGGAPASGKTVQFFTSRPGVDAIDPPAQVSDIQGKASATLVSLEPGVSTLTAVVMEDGLPVASPVVVQFTPSATQDLLMAIDQMTQAATSGLNEVKGNAAEIAVQGTFFRGAIGENAAKLGTDLVFNLADVMKGAGNTPALLKSARLACPGCYIQGTWNTRFLRSHPDAYRLLNVGFTNVEEAAGPQIADFIGWGGPKFYTAVLTETDFFPLITEAQAKQVMGNIFTNYDDGMTRYLLPVIRRTANSEIAMLVEQREELSRSLPIEARLVPQPYIDDLRGRTRALNFQGHQLHDEVTTLRNLHEAQDREAPFLLNFLLRWSAKKLAWAFFGGPGLMLVGGTLGAFDYYMDKERLNDSIFAYNLSTGAILNTQDILREIGWNASSGMSRITSGIPGQPPTGTIDAIRHYHTLTNTWSFAEETESWSEVTVTNTGLYDATFLVFSNYLADVKRFGLPWATMEMTTQAFADIPAGQTRVIRIPYKEEDGTQGFSPRSRVCILINNCVDPATTFITVLANNAAGTFSIAETTSLWQPSTTGSWLVRGNWEAEDEPTIIDPPLTSYILPSPISQTYTGSIWFNNPFPADVQVTLAQPVPSGAVVIDPGGGALQGNALSWTKTVPAGSLAQFSFVFSLALNGDETGVLPPATVQLNHPETQQPLSDASNQVTFNALPKVALEADLPEALLPGEASSGSLTITNLSQSSPVNGSYLFEIQDSSGAVVVSTEHPVEIVAGQAYSTQLEYPALSEKGRYLARVQMTVAGNPAGEVEQSFQVGLEGVIVTFEASPFGQARPGDLLSYTATVKNLTGVNLEQTTLSIPLPEGGSLVPNSITGNGSLESGTILWTQPLAVGQTVEQSFVVRIDPGATVLTCRPTVTAAEILPNLGPQAFTRVDQLVANYLPVLRR
jgi:uncharacterized repeat protein (TIGR01451 family)